MSEEYDLTVCTDCLMAAAGYTEDELGRAPEYAPLTRLDGYRVVPVVTDDKAFSNLSCDGCESPLAGSRYPVVLMNN